MTGKAFAWINVSHGLPAPYSQLRHLAIQEWRRLDQDLGHGLPIDWCGALTWNRDLADTERFAGEQAAWGHDVHLVERREIARLEPNLIDPPECAAYAAAEGAVDPTVATGVLVAAARAAGAEVLLDGETIALTSKNNGETIALTSKNNGITGIETPKGPLDADRVVLAAGTGARLLAAPLGLALPVASSPALLLRFKTAGRLVERVISSPDMEIRQASDLSLLAAENYLGPSSENGPDAIAQRTRAVVRKRLRGSDGLDLEEIGVGMRPIPADGLPIVGFSAQVAGLYIAVMHAGVTLAPAVGRLAATEILDGMDQQVLRPCRLERFTV